MQPRKFSWQWAPMYRAHCAVIFAIAQLSCLCMLRTVSWPHRWTDYDARWLIARVFDQGSAFWGLVDEN